MIRTIISHFFYLFIGISVLPLLSNGQNNDPLYNIARAFMLEGDLDNAITNYNTILKNNPGNIDALQDYCYILYLKKEYPKAVSVGKELIANPKANDQSYQLLGLAYKGMKAFPEAAQLYKTALEKYPESGMLWNDYGEMFAMQGRMEEAIKQWESGIKLSPNVANNYYNAAMYYYKVKQEWFWAIQYGEIFVNLDSYSEQTANIKTKVAESFLKLSNVDTLNKLTRSANNNFEKKWLELFALLNPTTKEKITTEGLTFIRRKIATAWKEGGNASNYPFHLYEHHLYLDKENLFDAYDQWLFGNVLDEERFKTWVNQHAREFGFFKDLQQNKRYLVPTGEYYR